jgi:hypothetical protein
LNSPVQWKLLSQNKLTSSSRKKHTELNAKLFYFWDNYNTCKIDQNEETVISMHLLTQISTLYSEFNADNFNKCPDDKKYDYDDEFETTDDDCD